MNTQNIEKRFYNVEEVAAYLGVGVSHARRIGKKLGAEKKIGSRSVFDRKIIDNYFDNNNAVSLTETDSATA